MRPRKPGRASALTVFFLFYLILFFVPLAVLFVPHAESHTGAQYKKKETKLNQKKKIKPLVKPSKTRWDPTKFRVKLEFKKKKRMAFKSKRGDWKTGKTSLPTGLWFDYYYWRGLLKRIARILVASLIIYLWAQNRCRYAEMRYGLTK